jgi:hypothetical protein
MRGKRFMMHIKDLTYKGHEIIINKDSRGFIADVRSDEFEGELVAGYCELASESEAIEKAKFYIDTLVYVNNLAKDPNKAKEARLQVAYDIIGNLDDSLGSSEWIDKAIERLKQLKYIRENIPF